MSRLNVKYFVISSLVATPEDNITGTKALPYNLTSTISFNLPRGKMANIGTTGFKLLNFRGGTINSQYAIYSQENGNITVNAGSSSVSVDFNDQLWPPWWGHTPNTNIAPPVNISFNSDFALSIQSTMNAAIDASVPAVIADFGGASPLIVTWYPASAEPSSNGYYIFANKYSVLIQLDFRTRSVVPGAVNGSMGNILGFGNSETDFGVSLMSRHTVIEMGEDGASHIYPTLVMGEFIVPGIDTGVLLLNGAKVQKNILSVVPGVDLQWYQHPENGYTLIQNSVFYTRIKEKIYDNYTTTNQPEVREVATQAYDDPYFRIKLLSPTGFPLLPWVGEPRTATYLMFAVMFNEVDAPVRRVV